MIWWWWSFDHYQSEVHSGRISVWSPPVVQSGGDEQFINGGSCINLVVITISSPPVNNLIRYWWPSSLSKCYCIWLWYCVFTIFIEMKFSILNKSYRYNHQIHTSYLGTSLCFARAINANKNVRKNIPAMSWNEKVVFHQTTPRYVPLLAAMQSEYN
jgi:hypothetical protein